MPAIAKAALPEVRPEFHECRSEFIHGEMMNAENLHAGLVDHIALGIQLMYPRVGGGVLAVAL